MQLEATGHFVFALTRKQSNYPSMYNTGKKRVRVGILGGGRIGKVHARSLVRAGAQVVVVSG